MLTLAGEDNPRTDSDSATPIHFCSDSQLYAAVIVSTKPGCVRSEPARQQLAEHIEVAPCKTASGALCGVGDGNSVRKKRNC